MTTSAEDPIERLRALYRPLRERLQPPDRAMLDAFVGLLVGLVASATQSADECHRELAVVQEQLERHGQGLDDHVEAIGQLMYFAKHPEPPPAWIEHLDSRPLSHGQRVEVCGAIASALMPEDTAPRPRAPRPEPEPEPESAVTVEAIVAACAKGRAA